MSSDTLKAKKRDKVGTRSAKKLRLEGRIPANLQGENQDHVDFSIDQHEFLASRRHHVHLYDLDIDGDVQSAVVRELQYDAFGDNIIHVEFKRVIRGQKTDSEVSISYYGHPKGGVLNQLVTHVTVSCLPSEIPDSLEVRVGGLDEGDSLHARDIPLPEGMTLVTDGDVTIASVSATRGDLDDEATGDEDGDESPLGGAAPAPEDD